MSEVPVAPEAYRAYLQELRRNAPKVTRGLVLVYTGDGKGKTTAALGIAVRALGVGWRVAFLQFIKGPWKSSEEHIVPLFGERWLFRKLGRGFTWEHDSLDEDQAAAQEAWQEARNVLLSGDYEVVVLDEINYVLSYRFLPVEMVIETLRQRPSHVHVVCTGRNAPEALVAFADLVTEMRKVKHPFDQGVLAQRGLDF